MDPWITTCSSAGSSACRWTIPSGRLPSSPKTVTVCSEGDIAREFFHEVVEMARRRRLLSDEHFTVDGTLLEAWASHKSFRRKDGEPPPGTGGRDFRGERRSNDTHASTTDPDARLYRRTHHGEAKLAYLGHVLMENRNGLAVGGCVTHATGYAEREAALEPSSSPGERPNHSRR